MAVTIASQKNGGEKHARSETLAKKHGKLHHKTRPITATLDHPLILDIKLLKRLDMTTFTKKGLIALSKFCGISLINKTDTKNKFSKTVKTIRYPKKQTETAATQTPDANKRDFRTKRKSGKHLAKGKPRIRFKMAKEDTSPDEDSLDVVCRSQVLGTFNRLTTSRSSGQSRKTVVDGLLEGTVENVVPEPCKTCSRSEHPERLHSHPKMLTRLASEEKSNDRKLEERFRKSLTTKDAGEDPSAKESERRSVQTPNSSKSSSKSPTKSSSSGELSSPESGKGKRKNLRSPFTKTEAKKAVAKTGGSEKEETKTEKTGEEAMKFVTGCYVCGKQLSPKSRMKHEKSCIVEWRTQNVLVPADKRKAEPKRPDFRFTASGDLDCEGSFESIWANHMDSLVPCRKCGRRFFPDRIERHENCCNNAPVGVKYKH